MAGWPNWATPIVRAVIGNAHGAFDSTNPLPVQVQTGGGTQPVSIANGADVAEGSTTDAAVSTDANGTVNAHIRGLVVLMVNFLSRFPAALGAGGGLKVDGSGTALPVTGTKTNNNAAPDAGQLGVLPALANAASPTWTEGYSVRESVDLSGNQRTTLGTLISGENQTFNTMDVAGKFTPATAAAAATTTIKSGAGRVKRVIFPTLVASGTCKIYDNTAASGTVLLDTVTIPGTITADNPFVIDLDMAFSTGLTVVMTGTNFVADVPYL